MDFLYFLEKFACDTQMRYNRPIFEVVVHKDVFDQVLCNLYNYSGKNYTEMSEVKDSIAMNFYGQQILITKKKDVV